MPGGLRVIFGGLAVLVGLLALGMHPGMLGVVAGTVTGVIVGLGVGVGVPLMIFLIGGMILLAPILLVVAVVFIARRVNRQT